MTVSRRQFGKTAAAAWLATAVGTRPRARRERSRAPRVHRPRQPRRPGARRVPRAQGRRDRRRSATSTSRTWTSPRRRPAATPARYSDYRQLLETNGHRRGRHQHARPLARAADDPRLRGGQGRLRREAALARRARGPRDGRRGAPAQARGAGRHPPAVGGVREGGGRARARRRDRQGHGRARVPRAERVAEGHRRAAGWPSRRPTSTGTPGSARRRSARYNKNRTFYRFRWFYDYSGGQLTNFGVHYIDAIHWALGHDAPLAVTAMGGKFAVNDNREMPDTLEVLWTLPGRHARDLLAVQRDAAPAARDRRVEIEFRGTKGTLYLFSDGYEIVPDEITPNEFPARTPRRSAGTSAATATGAKPQIEPVKRTGGDADTAHHARNFLDCVKSRAACNCDIETGPPQHVGDAHRATSRTRSQRVPRVGPRAPSGSRTTRRRTSC